MTTTATWEDLAKYEAWLVKVEGQRQAQLMEGYRPPRPPFTGNRIYIHRDTKTKVVRGDEVWCLIHDVPLRVYPNRKGGIQRKCRPCANEYMVEFKRRARGQAERQPQLDDQVQPMQTGPTSVAAEGPLGRGPLSSPKVDSSG